MSYVTDPVLNVALAPSMSRAADLIELMWQGLDIDSKRLEATLGDDKRKLFWEMSAEWAKRMDKIAQAQSFMDPDQFVGEAFDIAEARRAKRRELQRDKWARKQKDLSMIDALLDQHEHDIPVDLPLHA